MTAALLTCYFALTPVQSAELIPDGSSVLHVDVGFALLVLGVPAVQALPILTGDLEVGYGITDGVDLRGRYRVHLGAIHRLGPEIRYRPLSVGAFSLALGLWVNASIAGAADEAVEFGGDISVDPALLVSLRLGDWALTADAGVSVQMLLFEEFADRSHVDNEPYLSFVNVGVSAEWAQGEGGNLFLRLEAAVPTAPDNPFTVGGFQPRLVVGGNLPL